MAVAKAKAPGGARPKKSIGGKLPTKRSINLIVVDENKINPFKALLGIILIVALAFAFGKFAVYDRLIAAEAANSRVAQLQATLDETKAAISAFGEVEDTYAHYTLEGMTSDELGLVDRTQVVELISAIIREQDNLFDMRVYKPHFEQLFTDLREGNNPYRDLIAFRENFWALGEEVGAYREQVLSWSVSSNMLKVEVTGKSLQHMNTIAREVEKSDIVDTCALTNASKNLVSMIITGLPTGVQGAFEVYLVQPPEATEEEVAGE